MQSYGATNPRKGGCPHYLQAFWGIHRAERQFLAAETVVGYFFPGHLDLA